MSDWKRIMAEVISALLILTLLALAVAVFAWALEVMADAVSGMLA